MKKFYTLLLFFVFFTLSFAQEYKFAWLSDIHIGAPNADQDLQNVIDDINTRDEIEFVVTTGDIGEKGRNAEFEKAKEILDQLKVPYYIIPGNHDTKWSESGCTKFDELWGDHKFVFDHNGIRHIGINTGVYWRGGGGHVSPEDLKWVEQVLDTTDDAMEIYFYCHHPLNNDVDNWFKVTNLLREKNIKAVLHGHGHNNRLNNFNGIPAAMGRSTLNRPKTWGYTYVVDKPDSLLFYEINIEKTPKLWGAISKTDTLEIPQIDSVQTQIINDAADLLWQKDLNSSVSTSLLVTEDKIFAAEISGIIHCYDLYGKELWKYDTGGTIYSRPLRDKDVLAAATIEGDLFAINANNGDLIQVLAVGETITSQLVKIDAVFNGYKTKAVLAGTASGKMICYDIYSLEQIWENSSAQGMIETLPLVVDNKIIYGSWDNYLYCIDAETGTLNWKWTENKNFYYSNAACSPVTDGKNVYVTSPDKFVSAIDLLLGTTVWRKNDFNAWESIGITNDRENLLVKSMMDKFYVVSAKDGKLVKEINPDFGLDTMPVSPIEWNGNIIFGAKNGFVYLINNQYEWTPVVFTGTARVHSVQHVKDNTFAASNMDGKIFVFSLK